MRHFWSWVYLAGLAGLAVYSYSQIDLNLTLLQTVWFLKFQKAMIQLGYFQRPISTGIFAGLTGLMLVGWLGLTRDVVRGGTKKILVLLGVITVLGILAYPGFSHDIFNYIFDTRILVHYHLNPYEFKALDFPDDLWTRFMHWTHRTYPYGPVWLGLSSIPYLLGLEKFLLVLWNFKTMFAIFYLGNVFLINRISKNLFAAMFFALNPLVIVESLISPHLDSAMLFFLLLAIYFWQEKFKAGLALVASVLIKFTSVIFLPLLIIKKDYWRYGHWLSLIPLIYVVAQREFYPWYFLVFLGLASLNLGPKLKIFCAALSMGLISRYLPFLYQGDYQGFVPLSQNLLTFLPLILILPWLLRRNNEIKTSN